MLLSPTLKIESNNAPINALKNPSTSKPGAMKPANINSSALITSVKSPSVTIFIGKVTNIRAGLINTFIKAITIATIKAFKNQATLIPGTTHAINIMMSAKPIQRKNSNIFNSLFFILL